MGVPAFYRWLSEKYPKIVVEVLENRNAVVNGIEIPTDLTQPNPNGIEYDNLYVDMNGLIHPCSHPEDREAPTSEEEMYINVTKYVDRLFAAVRPRKLLFLAIDGVAPRAKMNQQRSRRFRAVLDAKDRQKLMDEVLEEIGTMHDAPASGGDGWDSNVITPGTEFMYKLSLYLRFYILDRMNKFEAWRNIKVILSDANEPGEGEHKIMKFIRSERCQPGYNPNQHHILHGLDADLIMLALATHEPHFTILRELVTFGGRMEKDKSQGQQLLNVQNKCAVCVNPEDEWVFAKPLQALHIHILREYLQGEFSVLEQSLSFQYDFERVIDDFVFMCFFVGNDFLPHLPSLDIRDGALDFLLECYKDTLPSLGKYLTNPGGNVNLSQADVILAKVGEIEDLIFQRKRAAEDVQERNANQRRANNNRQQNQNNPPPPPTFARIQQPIVKPIIAKEDSKFVVKTFPVSNKDAALSLREKVLGKKRASPDYESTTTSTESQSLVPASGTVSMTMTESAAGIINDNDDSSLDNLKKKLIIECGITATATAVAAAVSEISTIKEEHAVDVDVDVDSSVIESKVLLDENDDGDGNGVEEEGNTMNEEVEEEEEEEEEVVEMDSVLAAVLNKVGVNDSNINNHPTINNSDSEIKQFVDPDEIKSRLKAKQNAMLDKYKETTHDKVRLHETGWKKRYYEDPPKQQNLEEGGGLQRMCLTYVQGLCWVLKYYYEGCPSWSWYYPFHYAPFASDLVNIDRYQISFELSKPFQPIEQLLSVLPAESVHALPQCCRWLMTDDASPIKDLYNSDIPIDPNGKHLPWLWILLLPFIDETRIMKAFTQCKDKLNMEEIRRNSFSGSYIFTHKKHQLSTFLLTQADFHYRPKAEDNPDILRALANLPMVDIQSLQADDNNNDDDKDNGGGGDDGGPCSTDTVVAITRSVSSQQPVLFDPQCGDGISGAVAPPAPLWYSRLDSTISAPKHPPLAFMDINSNQVLSLTFIYPPEVAYNSRLLDGYFPKPRVLEQYDLVPKRPPRLNKSRFNMLDLSKSHQKQQQQQQQQQGYQQNYSYANGTGFGYQDHERGYNYRNNNDKPRQHPHQQFGSNNAQRSNNPPNFNNNNNNNKNNNSSNKNNNQYAPRGFNQGNPQRQQQPQQQQQQQQAAPNYRYQNNSAVSASAGYGYTAAAGRPNAAYSNVRSEVVQRPAATVGTGYGYGYGRGDVYSQSSLQPYHQLNTATSMSYNVNTAPPPATYQQPQAGNPRYGQAHTQQQQQQQQQQQYPPPQLYPPQYSGSSGFSFLQNSNSYSGGTSRPQGPNQGSSDNRNRTNYRN